MPSSTILAASKPMAQSAESANDLGGAFDKVHGLQGGSAVQHLLNEHCQLTQPDAAGHALAAGLGMA